ncbi:MAG TPA: energy transducer TonB [Terriglobales bacterium]|jgi:periplasmic protein TonB|nr:energy transducer TonB [Terriglobales bacterium]
MAELETPQNPQALGPEPELHLLLNNQTLDEPLWKSLFRNLDDFFFPKKLPPLVLTSKPIPVRDIWGFYNYKGRGAFGSTVIHVLALALIIAATYVGRKIVDVAKPKETVLLIAPDDLPVLPPSKTMSGGGGGGGDRDKLQASPGRLPKQSMQQFTPPMVVVRNLDPKLAVPPTIVVPPDIHLQQPNMPELGDPLSHLPSVPSNGTGSGGGIGSGNGGGVGSGEGPGFGPGRGGGTGGGVFRVGGGVSAPKEIYAPEPEYSEEARKVKHMGTVVLQLVVGSDGNPRDIRVVRTLGLGLDEKAIEAVRRWRFEPAKKDGKPVAALVSVEVDFHLY